MEKHLEIFKHIEELYKGDTSDEETLQYAEKNTAKMEAWRDAFEGYLLRDVLDVIDEFFAKKNNKTPPRISQIKALLNANHIHDDREQYHEKTEHFEPSFGLKIQQIDKENGDMHWFVPDYLEVERLICEDHWGWVYNINNPTIEEFHRCIEEWCLEKTGHKYRFYSRNDIAQMSQEQQDELWQKCHNIVNQLDIKKLN